MTRRDVLKYLFSVPVVVGAALSFGRRPAANMLAPNPVVNAADPLGQRGYIRTTYWNVSPLNENEGWVSTAHVVMKERMI